MIEPSRMRIAIVGGGLGGSCLANALIAIPHLHVEVYEAKPAFSERGASLTLHDAALKALDEMLASPDTMLAKAGAVPTKAGLLLLGSGPQAGELVLDLAGVSKTQARIVQRSSLLRELLALLPSTMLHTNKKVVSFTELDSGKVHLEFEDGGKDVFDAAIGADGLSSTVRSHVHGESATEHAAAPAGFWDSRNMIPYNEAKETIGERYFREGRQHGWIGHKGFIMHDIAEDKTMVQVVLCRVEDEHPKDRKRPLTKESLESDFREWENGPIAPGMINLTLRQLNPTSYSQWEHKTTPTYAKGRVCVMGDAAHAMTPFMASGVATAFEDAMVLAHLFAEAIRSPEDITNAFRAYDAVRRPRCQRIIDASRGSGYMMCGQNEEAGLDPKKLVDVMRTRWAFIVQLDVAQHKKEVLQALETFKSL